MWTYGIIDIHISVTEANMDLVLAETRSQAVLDASSQSKQETAQCHLGLIKKMNISCLSSWMSEDMRSDSSFHEIPMLVYMLSMVGHLERSCNYNRS